MPAACQNETETKDIQRFPDDNRTGRKQESGSRPLTMNDLLGCWSGRGSVNASVNETGRNRLRLARRAVPLATTVDRAGDYEAASYDPPDG